MVERRERAGFALGDRQVGAEGLERQGDLGGRRVGHRLGEEEREAARGESWKICRSNSSVYEEGPKEVEITTDMSHGAGSSAAGSAAPGIRGGAAGALHGDFGGHHRKARRRAHPPGHQGRQPGLVGRLFDQRREASAGRPVVAGRAVDLLERQLARAEGALRRGGAAAGGGHQAPTADGDLHAPAS